AGRAPLAADLDAIVLKAMRKEPERRYGSATDLADDVRRHLVGWPVTARRDGLAYRAAKFARRHRTPLATAASAALAASLLGALFAHRLAPVGSALTSAHPPATLSSLAVL